MWSVALYGAETWTTTQADGARLSAFEMWVWRRMENISWVERVSNDEVLQRAGVSIPMGQGGHVPQYLDWGDIITTTSR